jgi:hypothetical protein
MDELITHRATRPASPEHRLVPIEVFLTDSAEAWLNWKHHRLPLAAAFSNTHGEKKYSGTAGGKTSKRVAGLLKLSYSSFRFNCATGTT